MNFRLRTAAAGILAASLVVSYAHASDATPPAKKHAAAKKAATPPGPTVQEQIESLDQEAEGHDRDRGANPGQEGPLVRGVIAVPLNHRHSRVYGRRRDGPCPTNDGAYR